MSISREILNLIESIGELSNRSKRIYNKLIKTIREYSYTDAVDYIEDIVQDRKLRFLLSLGFGGDLATLFLSSRKVYLPVRSLVPTQNEIDLSSSLAWSINGKKSVDYLFKDKVTVIAPIVTFKNTFVIDGHHRWSQAYCTNPEVKVLCINFSGDLSPISMLKAVQATIGSNTGRIPKSHVRGLSIYDASESQIINYISNNMTNSSSISISKHIGANSRDEVIKYLANNCLELKANNPPITDAPDRDLMPQTSKDPDSLEDLSRGVTRV